MVITCSKKCVVRYNEGDLNVGEMACVDRCVGKYMQAQEKVGQVLQNFEQQAKAQEAANAQLQNAQFRPRP
jgi:import inner membrane translocase subunit TIM10